MSRPDVFFHRRLCGSARSRGRFTSSTAFFQSPRRVDGVPRQIAVFWRSAPTQTEHKLFPRSRVGPDLESILRLRRPDARSVLRRISLPRQCRVFNQAVPRKLEILRTVFVLQQRSFAHIWRSRLRRSLRPQARFRRFLRSLRIQKHLPALCFRQLPTERGFLLRNLPRDDLAERDIFRMNTLELRRRPRRPRRRFA